MSHEIEVKLRLEVDAFARAGIALKLCVARHFEDNWLLDTEERQLGKKFSILRVRAVDGKGLLTYKEKAGADVPKSQSDSDINEFFVIKSIARFTKLFCPVVKVCT
jgi:uncharacterized protein YjbK